MTSLDSRRALLLLALLTIVSAAAATTVPFTEAFASDAAGWRNGPDTAAADWIGAGGADGGGHIRQPFNFVNSVPGPQGPVLFRAEDEDNASGGAFIGDWIADGVTALTAWVRHDATVPVNFFVRFAGPANFPGATAVSFAPIAPGAWTPIAIGIDPFNPQFVSFEGTDFNTVFSNIGHVQVGVAVPDALAGVDQIFDFDLDLVTITPEPSSAALLALGLLAAAGLRRRP